MAAPRPAPQVDAAEVSRLALKLAVLKHIADGIYAKYEETRKQAELVNAPARQAGIKTFAVPLPDGTETAGTISIQAGKVNVSWHEDVLLENVKASTPQHVEEYVDPAALRDPRVVRLLREHGHGEWVRERVKAARLKELEEEVLTGKEPGVLLNLETGSLDKVADIHRADPTGEFAWKPAKGDRDRFDQLIATGLVTEDGDVVAQDPAEDSPPEALAA